MKATKTTEFVCNDHSGTRVKLEKGETPDLTGVPASAIQRMHDLELIDEMPGKDTPKENKAAKPKKATKSAKKENKEENEGNDE